MLRGCSLYPMIAGGPDPVVVRAATPRPALNPVAWWLKMFFAPWFPFYDVGRIGQALICMTLQATIIGWIPAMIWGAKMQRWIDRYYLPRLQADGTEFGETGNDAGDRDGG